MCTEVKADMSKIRVDLITQVHSMEDKMSNCMSIIAEWLKTEMNDLRREVSSLQSRINEGQTEME